VRFIGSNTDIVVAWLLTDVALERFNFQFACAPSGTSVGENLVVNLQVMVKIAICVQVDYRLTQVYLKAVDIFVCFGQFLPRIAEDVFQFRDSVAQIDRQSGAVFASRGMCRTGLPSAGCWSVVIGM